MAIKGQLARLERQLAKRGNHPITFIIPYSSDKQKNKESPKTSYRGKWIGIQRYPNYFCF